MAGAEHAHDDYVRGEMDIKEHSKTYALFWGLTKWGSILMVAAMVLLAVTRTNAVDCKSAEQAAAHLNACGKLPAAAESAEL